MSDITRGGDLDLDLGSGVTLSWSVAETCGDRIGAIVEHPSPRTGTGRCAGAIFFDTPAARAALAEPRNFWQVSSWDPLTISPSVLCRGRNADGSECGFHGFIRGGKWVPA